MRYDLEEMNRDLEKLLLLTKDPHPGLATWKLALGERLKAVAQWAPSSPERDLALCRAVWKAAGFSCPTLALLKPSETMMQRVIASVDASLGGGDAHAQPATSVGDRVTSLGGQDRIGLGEGSETPPPSDLQAEYDRDAFYRMGRSAEQQRAAGVMKALGLKHSLVPNAKAFLEMEQYIAEADAQLAAKGRRRNEHPSPG